MAWGVPVRELRDQLTADDISDYQAWYEIEPYGTMPEDMRAAVQAYTTAAVQAKSPPPFSKFVLKWETPEQLDAKQSNQALRDWAKAMNKATK